MLEQYKETQKITYQILTNAIKNDELSHAYLFEITDNPQDINLIKDFIIEIITKDQKEKEKIITQINTNNYPELTIIKPEGLWIKKEQMDNLQEEFMKAPVIGKYKVYVIEEADKLNINAANSILKFLEEPNKGIIAILVTKNTYNVLATIRSRCQIIKLKAKKEKEYKTSLEAIKDYLNKEIDEEKLQKIQEFINYYEKNHLNTLNHLKKRWHNYIKTKEENISAMDIMTLYYKDMLNIKTNNKIEYFVDDPNIEKLSQKNTIKQIINKIEVIIKIKERLNHNANINMTIDKLIIKLEGVR